MSDDIAYMSAQQLVDQYRAKKLSPVEVTQATLARVHRLQPRLNAFVMVDDEGALAQARASEARWARGRPKGLLDGVPATVKDLHLAAGWPTLRGSRTVDPAGPWPDDAPTTARMRAHNAVLLGKTTTPEFGWKGVTDSPLTGITRNPWNPRKTPGGSSGGASAALAAGLGPLAVGSDGGGSIRIPSGFAGTFGLKCNFGRVPVWPASPMGTLSHNGPMTRTVGDAALLLNAIAEPDERDWTSLPYRKVDWTKGLDAGIAGLKVAFSPALGYARVDPEVARRVAAAAAAFAALGAHVEEVDPGFDDPEEIFRLHWYAGAGKALGGLPKAKKALLDPPLAAIVEEGRRIPVVTYLKAVDARIALGERMRRFHATWDLLLTPTLAVPAFDAGLLVPADYPEGASWMSWTPFSYPFNLTQQPACSIPCGFTRAGLPVGLQIVAANYREDLVLRAAAAYERAHPVDRRPRL